MRTFNSRAWTGRSPWQDLWWANLGLAALWWANNHLPRNLFPCTCIRGGPLGSPRVALEGEETIASPSPLLGVGPLNLFPCTCIRGGPLGSPRVALLVLLLALVLKVTALGSLPVARGEGDQSLPCFRCSE